MKRFGNKTNLDRCLKALDEHSNESGTIKAARMVALYEPDTSNLIQGLNAKAAKKKYDEAF